MAREYFMLIVKLEWELHDLSKMYGRSEGCVVENALILYIKSTITLIIYVIFDLKVYKVWLEKIKKHLQTFPNTHACILYTERRTRG